MSTEIIDNKEDSTVGMLANLFHNALNEISSTYTNRRSEGSAKESKKTDAAPTFDNGLTRIQYLTKDAKKLNREKREKNPILSLSNIDINSFDNNPKLKDVINQYSLENTDHNDSDRIINERILHKVIKEEYQENGNGNSYAILKHGVDQNDVYFSQLYTNNEKIKTWIQNYNNEADDKAAEIKEIIVDELGSFYYIHSDIIGQMDGIVQKETSDKDLFVQYTDYEDDTPKIVEEQSINTTNGNSEQTVISPIKTNDVVVDTSESEKKESIFYRIGQTALNSMVKLQTFKNDAVEKVKEAFEEKNQTKTIIILGGIALTVFTIAALYNKYGGGDHVQNIFSFDNPSSDITDGLKKAAEKTAKGAGEIVKFSKDALGIKPGEGWFETFKNLGISNEYWDKLLDNKDLVKYLKDSNIAYEMSNGELGIKFSNGEMPRAALAKIMEHYEELKSAKAVI